MLGATIVTTEIQADGTRRVVEEGHNLIVNSAYIAMAMAAKGEGAFFAYWASGNGGSPLTSEWDAGVTSGAIAPLATDAALTNEIHRKALLPADVVFIDSVGVVSVAPTNRIQITILILESEANGFLREWAIFGGDATAVLGSGMMVNRKVHLTYEKTTAVKLERVVKFAF